MSVFDDVSQFLEERLDEFLRTHPQLELQVLEEKLREQEHNTLRLLADLEAQLKRQQDAIMVTAREIQRWHQRIEKAQKVGRQDLVQAAPRTRGKTATSGESTVGTNGADQAETAANPGATAKNPDPAEGSSSPETTNPSFI